MRVEECLLAARHAGVNSLDSGGVPATCEVTGDCLGEADLGLDQDCDTGDGGPLGPTCWNAPRMLGR